MREPIVEGGVGAPNYRTKTASGTSSSQPAPRMAGCDITVTISFATKRKRDFDDQNKISFYALAGIAYDDHSQISAVHLTRSCNPTNPRKEVVVQETTAL